MVERTGGGLGVTGVDTAVAPIDTKTACINNYVSSVMANKEATTQDGKDKKCEVENTSFNGHVAEFAQSFSAHGFGKIYESRQWWRRVLWVAVCIVMMGYGSYQCYKVIAEYLTYPKKVTIGVEEDTIAEFPAVTVCNLNPLAAREHLKDHDMWSAFVALEEKNIEPDCDNLTDGYDYDDFYDDYYNNYEDDSDAEEDVGTSYGYDAESTTDYSYTYGTDHQTHTTYSTYDYESDGTYNPGDSTSDYQYDTTGGPTDSWYDYQSHSSGTPTDSTNDYYQYDTSDTTTDSAGSHSTDSTPPYPSDSTDGSTTSSPDDSTTSSASDYDYTDHSTSDSMTSSTPGSPDSSTPNSPDGSTTDSTSRSTTDGSGDYDYTDYSTSGSTTASTSNNPTGSGSGTEGTDYYSTTYDTDYDDYGDYTTGSEPRIKRSADSESVTTNNNNNNNNPARGFNKRHHQDPKQTHYKRNKLNSHTNKEKMLTEKGRQKVYKMLHSPEDPKMVLKTSGRVPRPLKKNTLLHTLPRKRNDKGNEEEEEDEIQPTLLPDGSRHLPVPSSSRRSQVTDFATFTETYRDRFQRTHTQRTKRSAQSGENVMMQHEAKRLQCSIYYSYFHHLKAVRTGNVMEGEFKVDEEDQDTCHDENYKEVLSYNPLCRLEVVCDNYGCFDYELRQYTEVSKTKNGTLVRCPSCASKVDDKCWPASYFTNWETGYLTTEQVEDLFKGSHTPDLSDIIGAFTPTIQDLANFSIPAKDFVSTCSYNRRPCSYKRFHVWNSDQYGRCYTFNSAFKKVKLKNGKTVPARLEKTSSAGPMSGLRLTLSIKSNEYLSLLSSEVGARVIVHSPHVLPFPEEQGFNVSPGFTASVSVARKVLHRVGKPHGVCRKNATTGTFKEYSSIRCRRQCVEQELWRACRCYRGKNPSYEANTSSSHLTRPPDLCSPFNVTQKACMDIVHFNYQQRRLGCDCPAACWETVYLTQATSSEENRAFYTIVQNMKKRSLGDDLCSNSSQSTVRIHIYLDTLSYERIDESPAYTWDTLICNFGGNLGLFLGMSIITMVELIEFLADVALFCFWWRKSRRHHLHNGHHTTAVTPQHTTPQQSSPPKPPLAARPPGESRWQQDKSAASLAFNRIFLGE